MATVVHTCGDTVVLPDAEKHVRNVLSVHSVISHTNVPIESFLEIDRDNFRLAVLSFYQTREQVGEFLLGTYTKLPDVVEGLGFSKHPVQSLVSLVSTMRRMRPDVIHVHHAFSAAMCSVAARAFIPAKVMMTLHNDFRTFRPFQKLFLLISMFFSHLVVCNSQSTFLSLGFWRKTLLRRTKFRVCYNGVNATQIAKVTGSKEVDFVRVDESEFIIGFVGRLIPQKDVPTLIKAFHKFHSRFEKSKLVIAGDGPLRKPLEQLVESLGISDVVRFLGVIPREDVYRLLADVDTVVVSSRWEGFCNSMVEAMFASKAIVASKINVLEEVLGTDCGLFFPLGNCDELAEQLVKLYKSSQLKVDLGQRARKSAYEKYSLRAASENYADCYRQILESV